MLGEHEEGRIKIEESEKKPNRPKNIYLGKLTGTSNSATFEIFQESLHLSQEKPKSWFFAEKGITTKN